MTETAEIWCPIDTGGYFDFSRLFMVEVFGFSAAFDSPFLEGRDEFSDSFLVYVKTSREDWMKVYKTWVLYDIVSVKAIEFDASKKKAVSKRCLEKIFGTDGERCVRSLLGEIW